MKNAAVHFLGFFFMFSSMAGASDPSFDRGPSFRARPLPQTSSYFVLEFGYSHRLSKTSMPEAKPWLLPGSVGFMQNLSMKNALGGDVHFGFGDQGSTAALRVRYRRWVESWLGVDLALGPILLASDRDEGDFDEYSPDLPGLNAGIGVDYQGLAGVSLEYEFIPNESSGRNGEQVYAGFHASSFLGVGLGIVMVIIAGIAVASL